MHVNISPTVITIRLLKYIAIQLCTNVTRFLKYFIKPCSENIVLLNRKFDVETIVAKFCEKLHSLSPKMMIYHKMSVSGVYNNVFQTTKNYSSDAKFAFQSSIKNESMYSIE